MLPQIPLTKLTAHVDEIDTDNHCGFRLLRHVLTGHCAFVRYMRKTGCLGNSLLECKVTTWPPPYENDLCFFNLVTNDPADRRILNFPLGQHL
jgi:hypothetical protein